MHINKALGALRKLSRFSSIRALETEKSHKFSTATKISKATTQPCSTQSKRRQKKSNSQLQWQKAFHLLLGNSTKKPRHTSFQRILDITAKTRAFQALLMHITVPICKLRYRHCINRLTIIIIITIITYYYYYFCYHYYYFYHSCMPSYISYKSIHA